MIGVGDVSRSVAVSLLLVMILVWECKNPKKIKNPGKLLKD